MNLALNNLQRLICHKTQPTNHLNVRILVWFYILLLFIVQYMLVGQVGRVFAIGPGYLGSIPGRVIPKTFKIVLDTSLLKTLQYKVGIKGKVEQSRERSSALPYILVSMLLKRESYHRPWLKGDNFTYMILWAFNAFLVILRLQ